MHKKTKMFSKKRLFSDIEKNIIQASNVEEENAEDVVLFFDGASKKNPGNSGGGWIVLTKKENGRVLAYGWDYLGPESTNNEAEYHALLCGLRYLLKDGKIYRSVKIYGDSKLVINHICGTWTCKAENLKPLMKTARDLVIQLLSRITTKSKIQYMLQHVAREENTFADLLSNVAVKEESKYFCTLETPTTMTLDELKTRCALDV